MAVLPIETGLTGRKTFPLKRWPEKAFLPVVMPIPHSSPDPEHLDRQHAEDAQYYRRALHELIDMGSDIARGVHRQATAEAHAGEDTVLASEPAPDATAAFERIARTIRRTIALARRVAEPLPERKAGRDADQASRQRVAARKHIIRSIEDTIGDRARSEAETEFRHAELMERMDGPDVDDSIVDRPVGEIIAEIVRDMGLSVSSQMWKRRMPADIAVLCARAAAPSGLRAAESIARIVTPGAWPGDDPPAGLAEADAALLRHAAFPAGP